MPAPRADGYRGGKAAVSEPKTMFFGEAILS
jgi:hypothetical protein